MNRDVMSVKEIAQYLGFGRAKIYQLVEANQIPVVKIGNQYRFYKPVIDEWLREVSMTALREKRLEEIAAAVRRRAKPKGGTKLSNTDINRFVHQLQTHRATR